MYGPALLVPNPDQVMVLRYNRCGVLQECPALPCGVGWAATVRYCKYRGVLRWCTTSDVDCDDVVDDDPCPPYLWGDRLVYTHTVPKHKHIS